LPQHQQIDRRHRHEQGYAADKQDAEQGEESRSDRNAEHGSGRGAVAGGHDNSVASSGRDHMA
jgi:hypothetical protein